MIIPYILMILSLGGILFIIIRKIPVLVKLPAQPEHISPPQPFWKRLNEVKNVFLAYLLNMLNWLEKGLRKFRIWFLKIDNLIIGLLRKIKEKSQVWTVRSRAWMEKRRGRKMEKLKVLEKLDEMEMLGILEEERKKQTAQKNNFKAEESAYIKLIAQDPKNPELYKRLGNLYLEQGNYKDAQEAFKQVLKLNPEDQEAKEKLKEISIDSK